jgi:nucleoside-diphosphate-sugar epimerase
MKVLVTGASGFVGQALCDALTARGAGIIRAMRTPRGTANEAMVGNIDASTDWRAALAGCDAVVHLAARVHVMHDTSTDPLAEFRAVNTAGTLHLARQSAQAGARRFVYLSSIKVNGEGATLSPGRPPRLRLSPQGGGESKPYTEHDAPAPEDAYAISKWEAEQGLRDIERASGMQVAILRPPLVYGPGVKANFESLMRLVARGVPLPLGAVYNRRSLIYLGNLVSAIEACLDHPDAGGKTFLVSDGEDVSTPELIRRLARAMGKPARLIPVPVALLRAAARLAGKSAQADRVLGSLAVDSSALRETLGWRPPFTLDEGLAQTVNRLTSR